MLLPITVVLAGCDEVVSFENEGRLCAFTTEPSSFGEPTPQEFMADAPIELEVMMDECAAGCPDEIDASCEARLDGGVIEVTSRGFYREEFELGLKACPAICIPVVARCQTPPLPAGTYQLVHGDFTLALDIPSESGAPRCIGLL